MTAITLHRSNPTKNLHRYYRLDVQPRTPLGQLLRSLARCGRDYICPMTRPKVFKMPRNWLSIGTASRPAGGGRSATPFSHPPSSS